MGKQLVAFLGGGVQTHRIIHPVIHAERHLLVTAIHAGAWSVNQVLNTLVVDSWQFSFRALRLTLWRDGRLRGFWKTSTIILNTTMTNLCQEHNLSWCLQENGHGLMRWLREWNRHIPFLSSNLSLWQFFLAVGVPRMAACLFINLIKNTQDVRLKNLCQLRNVSRGNKMGNHVRINQNNLIFRHPPRFLFSSLGQYLPRVDSILTV